MPSALSYGIFARICFFLVATLCHAPLAVAHDFSSLHILT